MTKVTDGRFIDDVVVNGPDGVPVSFSENVFFNDSVANLASSATFTGVARDTGAVAGVEHHYAQFNAFSFSAQAGTMRIECSNDNTNWRRMTAVGVVAANTPVILTVPVMTRYHRVVYVNGATLQTVFMLNSSFTAS